VPVSSGAAVAGAKVTATNTATFVTANTVSTTSGTFTLPFLQPGTYSVAVEAPGFASDIRRDIPLDVDQTVNLDFVLQVSSIRQTIEVTGAAPLLQTETADVRQELTIRQSSRCH